MMGNTGDASVGQMGNTGDGSVGHRPEWCESSCQSGNLSFFQTQIALCYRSIGSNVRLILFLSNTENRPLCYGVVRLAMTGVGSLMRAEICGFPKRNGILYKNKISGGAEMLPLMFYGFSNG